MLKLTKTVIEITTKEGVIKELKQLAERIKNIAPNIIAINAKTLKTELNVKLTDLQFAELAIELGFKPYRYYCILIKDILEK